MPDPDINEIRRLAASNPEQAPGTWGPPISEAEILSPDVNDSRLSEQQDEPDFRAANLVKIFEEIGISPKEVKTLYSGAGNDTRLTDIFGRKLVHLDPDPGVIERIQSQRLKAVESKIEDYEPPELFDILYAQNSYGTDAITEELIERIVKPGGYIIANNWTCWANKLYELKNVKLIGGTGGITSPEFEWKEGKDISKDEVGFDYIVTDREGKQALSTEPVEDSIAWPRNADHYFVFQVSKLEK